MLKTLLAATAIMFAFATSISAQNKYFLTYYNKAEKFYASEDYIKAKLYYDSAININRKHALNQLSSFLKENEMLPAIAFVFSRKNVEACAHDITVTLTEFDSKIGYTVRNECEQIIRKLPNFKEYLELPEYNSLVSLLEKGIGIHHSGMIPILREIVELMISKKYIKILFATESFAIGLNCPIRTAIFTSLTKFDGSGMRYLLPHEYNQAASRCGRRGLDTIGHVVHCNNLFDLPTSNEYKEILCGKPQTLVSKFRISFPVVLNLMRNSQCSISDFVGFVDKSMVKNELRKSLKVESEYLSKLQSEIDNEEMITRTLRTPIESCNRYNYLKDLLPTVANKKRKEADREMNGIVDEYRNCIMDSDQIRRLNKKRCELEDLLGYIAHLETYIPRNTKTICDILLERKFIEQSNESDYIFTNLGRIASGIAEMHPLVTADCMNSWIELTPKQIVGLLSCFTDVKIEQDSRASVPITNDAKLKRCINEIVDAFRIYEDLERIRKTDPAYNYDNPIIYDMTEVMMEWCDLSDEIECRVFIRDKLVCSVGDFAKAILKISAIAKELIATCEQNGMVEFQHKLSQIDGMILKFVATSQSLYL